MRGTNEDEVCDFVAFTKDKVRMQLSVDVPCDQLPAKKHLC